MKKIALLFTLLCVGALNGMESFEQVGYWGNLPAEIKRQIIKYDGYLRFLPDNIKVIIVSLLGTTSDNLDDAIKDIKLKSSISKQWYIAVNDQKAFTALVHMLADKFDLTTDEVASKFNTPAAETYLALGHNLLDYAGQSFGLNKITELIKQGADVNFSSYKTPLGLAITNLNIKGVKLLLDAGANPIDQNLYDAIEMATHANKEEAIMIKQLIEQAIKK